jgi:branched-chain amino acid aminotransferase
MKAYRGDDGKIRLFRPDLNMKRMLSSAERMVLPVRTNDKDIYVMYYVYRHSMEMN